MARREFTRTIYAQIVHRATNALGQIQCEGCGLVLGKKPYHVDHTIPDALFLDKSRKLTAEDGRLLGKECCHDPKTRKVDIPAIAEAKRREAKHLGIARPAGRLTGPAFARSDKSLRREAAAAQKAALPPKMMFSQQRKEPAT
ncbi:hypothetical protein LB542_19935 [Mesorhizobium sp. BR1-1-9]|uniref:hypothetical protein n=1 Tax=Mesorhizobium sp. BR1-1-9 TaxID=2876646 RepID=UPI001CD11368|nr:hypothetical protein [Mesorhizobium sp. BR1-1-9]MBZ9873122.1 hypothetical protein [Mesorhizobium sp. BR1-1-9]